MVERVTVSGPKMTQK